MNAATSISVTSASPTASASISLPAAGLPDLSVFAGNESGTSSTANAEYINTIRFVYTGSGHSLVRDRMDGRCDGLVPARPEFV
ncbi:hypothetical protein LFML04_0739 [Leptospirillum ferriphilum ML-04]|uniref:Uncharacterized protein n=2 Tax=Leptospirillum ferriphilum TaxID=178606 RepID=J9ZAP6_LEPFM|nr:hypothetical protein LFML04_0739 [Leptospirillum ferriphilum ML-04]